MTAVKGGRLKGGLPSLRPGKEWREWITLVVRIALAAILGLGGYAQFSEAGGPQKGAVSSSGVPPPSSRTLPQGGVGPVALGLPVREMALAALILLGFAPRVMAICVGLLF